MSEKVDWGPIWTSFMDKESYFIDWKLACYHSYVKITLFTSRKILGPPPPFPKYIPAQLLRFHLQ